MSRDLNTIYSFLLSEKYYKYSFPSKKSLQLYDFYVLDYLKFLIDNVNRPEVRDLDPDIVDSVNDAVKTLYPALREELLDAVFYAVTAEFRHAYRYNKDIFKDNKYNTIYKAYREYTLGDQKDPRYIPSSKVRPPETEKIDFQSMRNASFKAAHYAIEKTNSSRAEFISMCRIVFGCGKWAVSYGGLPWARICEGWLMLNDADRINVAERKKGSSGPVTMGVAIDHVYDLQHNTDTVFNKLRSYYDEKSEYKWITAALNHKANARSYYELLGSVSGTVKALAIRILHNKLGTTWQEHIEKDTPNRVYSSEKEKFTDNTKFPPGECEEYTNTTFNHTKDERYSKFKIGDIVTLKSNIPDNPMYEVASMDYYYDVSIDEDGLGHWVYTLYTFENGKANKFLQVHSDEENLKLASPASLVFPPPFKPTNTKPPTFEVGDIVTCSFYPQDVKFKIDRAYLPAGIYKVTNLNSGYKTTLKGNNLQLVEGRNFKSFIDKNYEY